MRVSDVLSSKGSDQVFTIDPTATVSDLLDAFAAHDVGALVVADDSGMLGVVSERDVVRKLRGVAEPGGATVASIMTTDVRTCSPEDSFGALMALMTEHRVRHVPVLLDGELVGILSIGDAVKHRMDQLEFERDQLTSYVAGG